MVKYGIFIFLLLTFFFSCDEKPDPPAGGMDSLLVDSTRVDTLQPMQTEKISSAPDWYYMVPVRDGFLMASASARSSREDIALKKARFKAQAALAEKWQKMQLKAHPDSAWPGGKNETFVGVEMGKTIVKKQENVREGSAWRAYVLVEMQIKE